MHKILLLFSLFLYFSQVYSQNPPPLRQLEEKNLTGKGRIFGELVDSLTGSPVGFASIALLQHDSTLTGTLSKENGSFQLSRIAPGEYILEVMFMGYATKRIAPIRITDNQKQVDVGRVALSMEVKMLDELTVREEKQLIEMQVDRLIYHAEKDISTSGGTAVDVLQKVPMLTVDIEGNVQVLGSSKIRVLINKKPSSIFASSIGHALRQIPADMIKSVEVITSPSAKYDAEGSGGIINIILKKNTLHGLTGSVYGSAGNRSSNSTAHLNFNRSKFGIAGSSGFSYYNSPMQSTLTRQNHESADNTMLEQKGNSFNEGIGGFGELGVDYTINEKNTFNAAFRYNRSHGQGWLSQNNRLFDESKMPLEIFDRSTGNSSYTIDKDVNFDYTKTFRQKGREWSLLGLSTEHLQEDNFSSRQFSGGQALDSFHVSSNVSSSKEHSLQTDYVHPFSKKGVLELGAKAILREVDSHYSFSFLDQESNQFEVDPLRSNNFAYQQSVLAAYSVYKFSLKKIHFMLGARYEQTSYHAKLREEEQSFSGKYHNLVPSLSLMHNMKENKIFRLSYSQRLQRPLIDYLNPYVNYQDPKNLFTGNPKLNPETVQFVDLSYTYFKQGTTFTSSIFSRFTNNAIERILFASDSNGIVTSSFANIASRTTYGWSVFGGFQPLKGLRVNANINVHYSRLRSPQLQTFYQRIVYNFTINSSYTFKNGLSMQVFLTYNIPDIQLQGRSFGMYTYNLSTRKAILKNKGSISLILENPFMRLQQFRTELHTVYFASFQTLSYPRQAFRLNISYEFGKMEYSDRPSKKSKRIKNEDAKQRGSSAN